MKKIGIIGLACLTAGIGLAGCAGSNEQPTEATTTAETTTAAETTTTTAETTTTTQETTTTAEETTTTTEAPTTTAKAHPEDDQIMENLRAFYKSHEIVDGVPTENDVKYAKYAIADFDGDGQNEVMIEMEFDLYDDINHNLYMYNHDDDINDEPNRVIYYTIFENVTFCDNGVAYSKHRRDQSIDGKEYFILSDKILESLNYNLNNFHELDAEFILDYFYDEGRIMKHLHTCQDYYFNPVEKTQEQYESDMTIINGGKELDFQIKDFTAENIGL